MRLSRLIKGVEVVSLVNYKNVNISMLTHNHNSVELGAMFFAISGTNTDGHIYCSKAVELGAKCIVVTTPQDIDNVVQIVVKDVRQSMSIIARNNFNCADTKLKIIGVVGTNGKTTISNMLYNILRFNGNKVGLIGTLGVKINDLSLPSDMTTPDPIELHYYLNQMVTFGVEYVIMEISAHAIALQKMYDIKCEMCVFTNITCEHLDYFKTMQNYASTKVDYFDSNNMKLAVINVDDKYGCEILKSNRVNCATYGLTNPSDIFAIDIKMSLTKSSFIVNVEDDVFKLVTPFVGVYNVYNIMSVILVAKKLGLKTHIITSAFANMKNIDGRMEIFNFTKGNKVIVDFAHTPDGFEKVLSYIKSVRTKGKLIVLFGCVSYADKSKRRAMGKIALRYGDKVILTQDNPDYESFEHMCKDVGIAGENVLCIKDRKTAIEWGVKMLTQNDTLVCLGKGGETKQKIDGKNVEYNELQIVKNLKTRGVV